jgi:hypothetical protein
MSGFEVTYDKKAKKVVVECPNVFDDVRKGCKDVLFLNALQAYVEVPLDEELSDGKGVEKAVEKKLESINKELHKEVEELVATLRKLQKEEQQGNKKAAAEADKLVKEREKAVKKWADTFGVQVRKAVQEEYIEQTKSKTQLRSIGRTHFRGMELADKAFKEDRGAAVSEFVGEFGKGLAAVGSEAFKLSNDEKDARLSLADSVKQLKATLDKYAEDNTKKGGKPDLDIALWAKNHAKEVHQMEQAKDKYVDLIKEFERKLTATDSQLDKLDKLIGQEKSLKDSKDLVKEVKAFKTGRETIAGTFEAKLKAASLVDRLFSDDYSKGATFVAAYRALEAQNGTAKSGKSMQEAGREIEKMTKK